MGRLHGHQNSPAGCVEAPPSPGEGARVRGGEVIHQGAEPGLGPTLGLLQTMSPHAVLGLVLQVTMPGEPVDVACGVDHMVTLAKSFV